MVLGKPDSYMQKNERRPISYMVHKINFTWIKDLNMRPETIKFMEENIGSNVVDVTLSSSLLINMYSQARETKQK